MRPLLAALAASAAVFALGGCQATEDVRSGVEQARSSAASLGSGAADACRASRPHVTTLNDLADRLAADPDLRVQLAPQVRRAVGQLTASVGDQPELQPVVVAARDLGESIGQANRASVELAARQAQAALVSTRTLCNLAG